MYMHTDVSRSQTQSKTLLVVTSIKDMAEVEGNNCRFSIHVVWTLYPLIEGSAAQTKVSFASILKQLYASRHLNFLCLLNIN